MTTEERYPPSLTLIALCQLHQITREGGLVNLIGIHDNIHVRDLPGPVGTTVVMRWQDGQGAFTSFAQVVGPDDTVLLDSRDPGRPPWQFTLRNRESSHWVRWSLRFDVRAYGRHRIRVFLDGQEVGELPWWVRPYPPAPPHVEGGDTSAT